MTPIVYFFTNIASHYRRLLWEKMLNNKRIEYNIFFGRNSAMGISEMNFETESFRPFLPRLTRIKNYWFKGKYLIWQKGVIRKCLFKKPNMVMLLGEASILSNWCAILICRIRGIRVGLVGHGLYGDESFLKLAVRIFCCKMANVNLVYERRAKALLVSKGIKESNIHVIFNSLDYDKHKHLRLQYQNLSKSELFNAFENPSLPTLIFTGRLTKSKKVDLVLKAVKALNREQSRVNLFVLGDGSEKEHLEKLVKEYGLSNSVHFFGSCYDEEVVGKYLATADLCVSPGNVGLTAIHCLSFGTPVCTHSNFSNQGPEVESIDEDITGFFFEENNVDDLVLKLNNWLTSDWPERQQLREQCYKIIDTYYNPNYQLSVYERAVLGEKPML